MVGDASSLLPAGTKDKDGNEVWKARIGHFGPQELSNVLLAFTRVQLYNEELLQVTPNPYVLSSTLITALHEQSAWAGQLGRELLI